MKNMEFYATDNPIGSPNVNSIFSPDETTKTFTYQETDGTVNIDIILSNTSGTTGTYIDDIEVSGANFTLAESYSNRLLGANDNLTISIILNDTTEDESNGTVTVTYNNSSTVDITLDGELDGTLSNPSESITDVHFSIYPVPTSDFFYVNKLVTSIEIYGLSGNIVKEFKGKFNKNTAFDISQLSPNLYIVIAKDSNNRKFNSKLIKQ